MKVALVVWGLPHNRSNNFPSKETKMQRRKKQNKIKEANDLCSMQRIMNFDCSCVRRVNVNDARKVNCYYGELLSTKYQSKTDDFFFFFVC